MSCIGSVDTESCGFVAWVDLGDIRLGSEHLLTFRMSFNVGHISLQNRKRHKILHISGC